MKKIIIIPARMNSSRFYGKPLKLINKTPMIGHVYNKAKLVKQIKEVYVATCDKEIYDYIKSINGDVIMTSKKHDRASDRVAEALKKIEKLKKTKFDLVIMIQGDEPMISSKMIINSIIPFKDKNCNVVNLITKIKDKKNFYDPNEVKVVFDNNMKAIYFSREPIPSNKKYNKVSFGYKQVCIIPFRRNFLFKFNNLKQTKLEKIESVDMLRLIENNIDIKLVKSTLETYSVDTLEDLNKVAKLMKSH